MKILPCRKIYNFEKCAMQEELACDIEINKKTKQTYLKQKKIVKLEESVC